MVFTIYFYYQSLTRKGSSQISLVITNSLVTNSLVTTNSCKQHTQAHPHSSLATFPITYYHQSCYHLITTT